MKGISTGIFAIASVLFAVSCGDDETKYPAMGSDGGPCYSNGSCDDDLTCIIDTCFDFNKSDDTEECPDGYHWDDVTRQCEQDTIDPPEMVDVPAGEFQMGCNPAVGECGSDEKPYHAVTLSAYKIGKYEVAAGEYQECVTNGACNNSNKNEPHYYTSTDHSPCNLGAIGKDGHPMQCVTWYGAKAYCEWIGGRLPTEAEWEKAARGTDGRKYPWGNEKATCDYAVMDDGGAGGEGCGTGGTMPIGSKEAGKSPYGAYNMAGNVWEWVNDRYDGTYYETSPANNPAGPETGDGRVLRGGSWGNASGGNLSASNRDYITPGDASTSRGFRCAK